MKQFLLFAFTITFSQVYAQHPWTKKADFTGHARQGSVGFSIGTKGYVFGGYAGGVYYNDCWEYDPSTDSWSQKASCNGAGRISAIGFSIGTKGYIGLGGAATIFLNDLWEFNAAANTWTQKASYPDGRTSLGIAFSIGNKGYVGLGAGSYTNHLWEYDPATDRWTQKASFPGLPRWYAVAFSIGTKGYVGTGHYNDNDLKDFWEYDPAADQWTQKAYFGGQARRSAFAFSISGKGYIGGGTSYYSSRDTWEYDPTSDSWSQTADLDYLFEAASFSIGNKGYTGLGFKGMELTNNFWEFSACAKGNPSVFGDNVWNVYAWNSGDGHINNNSWSNEYLGYYTDTSLSFDTRTKWGELSSPSSASGYQGCTVNNDDHSWSAKRKGFPCGHYKINIPGHDDGAQLFIDGVNVWEHDGCCDSHANVWEGDLGSNSEIEFRVTEGVGSSWGAISCTLIPLSITADGPTTFCKGGSVTLKPNFATGNQWYKDGVVINDSTGQTYTATASGDYTVQVTITAGCTVTSRSTTVTVSEQPPPGDTSVFGDDLWNVYVWNSGNGTLTGAQPWSRNYSGYYTDNTLSFDTRSKWNVSSAPSNADNYQGCPVAADNHSWSAKRKGFPCGDYIINIVGLDDAAQLFVNGVKVWEPYGCCGFNAVWQGYLNAESKIEFRGTDGVGDSWGALDISLVKPTITPGNITTFCPGYSITLAASESQNGYLWSTGETTQTITVSQSGDYTVKEPHACGNQIESSPLTITVKSLDKPQIISYKNYDVCPNALADLTISNYDYSLVYTPSSQKLVSTYGSFYTAYAGVYAITATDVLGCSATSDSVTITQAPGNPDAFGENVWNIYLFDDGSYWGYYMPWQQYIPDMYGYGYGDINTYRGYYTENNLSFDTKNKWDENYSPAQAAGFQGCDLPYSSYDLFSWNAKRKGFSCGNYSISIPGHDDDAQLWINGVMVWEHAGCCDSHVNVWQGMLGPNSTIEFRVRDYHGACLGAIQIDLIDNNVVTKPVITPGSPINICSNASATLTSSAATGNTWSTGETTQSINVNTAGSYSVTVTGSEGCTAQSDPVEVTVTQAQTYYADADGDGYGDPNGSTQACAAPSGYVSNNTDCDDTRATVHPGAIEICDGLDNDCNGQIDEGVKTTFYRDADGDGYGNPNISTQACSAPAGYVSNNIDCDDTHASVYPGALEVCDGLDNNCNGQIDEGVKTTFYRDADGDGYGNPNVSIQSCSAPSGYVSNNTDCDDTHASVYPGAPEVCDGLDNNCNGQVDEGVKTTFYRDADGDGYGNPTVSTQACSKPSGYVSNNTDCDDTHASVYPGAPEVCDGLDNNCNGTIDEGCSTVTISINDVSMNEGNKGKSNMMFAVTLSKAATKKVTVQFATQNGTAIAGSDYDAKSGTLTFNPGTTKQTINISIFGDKTVEPNETFKVNLSKAVNATIAKASGTGTILNDDGVLSFAESNNTFNTTNDQSVKIAPNPATNIIHVELFGYTGNVTMQLMNLQGKIIKQEKIQTGNSKYAQQQINVGNITNGTYLLVIIDEKGNKKTEKVIIAR